MLKCFTDPSQKLGINASLPEEVIDGLALTVQFLCKLGSGEA